MNQKTEELGIAEAIHILENSKLVSDHFMADGLTATYVLALDALHLWEEMHRWSEMLESPTLKHLMKACESIEAERDAARVRIAELDVELQAYKKHGLEPCDYAGIVASDNRAKEAQNNLSILMNEYAKLKFHNKEDGELTIASIASEYLDICGEECSGDQSVGILPCRYWNLPDVGAFGEPLPCGCELKYYLEENGNGTEQSN